MRALRQQLLRALEGDESGRVEPLPALAGLPDPVLLALRSLHGVVHSGVGSLALARVDGDPAAFWQAGLAAISAAERVGEQLTATLLTDALAEADRRERDAVARLQGEFLEALRIGRVSIDLTAGTLAAADESFASFLGGEPDQLVGVPVSRFFPRDSLLEIVEQSVARGRPGRVQVRTIGLDRRELTLEVVAYLQAAAGTEILDCLVVNVSEAHAEVVRRRLLSAAIAATADLVLITDRALRVVYANPAFLEAAGYDADELLGRHVGFLHGRESVGPSRDRLLAAMRRGEPARVEIINYRRDGRAFWIDLSAMPVRGEDGEIEHWVSVARDVSERKRAEAEITRLAMEDHLTGLANRRAAEARLQLEWNRARRSDAAGFALALADVDHFKRVNDRLGHEAGDLALRHVAHAIESNLRGGDWVARWGGEEFLICYHNLDEGGALAAAERTRQQLAATSVPVAGTPIALTLSLGVSVYRPDLESIGQMLAEADGLLYEAKQAGRDRALCAGVIPGRRGTVIWEGAHVQRALREERVVAAFQPIVALANGEAVGDEAFARIVAHGEREIPAAEFIGTAKSLQLAAAIDEAVIRQAFIYPVARSAAHGPHVRFISLSPEFLCHAEAIERLAVVGARLRIDQPDLHLVVEVTERLDGNLARLRANLQPLVDAGLGLALDDFGSGYSSFQYLADLPIRYLKVEGWMVARMLADARTQRLIEGIVAAAHKVGLITVAECVEDQHTAERLRDIGIDWAQGYLFGAPAVPGTSPRAR